MARGRGSSVIKRATFTDAEIVLVIKVFKYSDFGLQWVIYSGGGSATIDIKGTLSPEQKLLDDSALNFDDPRWAVIDEAVFPHLPGGGGRTSNILPAADNTLQAIIVKVVFSGTLEFELIQSSQSRGT